MLPTISFAGRQVSRLIIGGNPFSGNSHVSSQMDEEMMNYFTVENIKKALFNCMKNGINTVQARGDRHITRILREFRQEGGDMHWIAQTASETVSGGLNEIMKYGPIAIYHHGTVTDSLYKEKKYDKIQRNLRAIRETGKWTGLGTHMPEVVEYAEAEGWDIDFYMTSIYNLSRTDRVSSAVTGKANEDEVFDDGDRALMYEAIRKTEKPCLVFKILGATRRCGTPDSVKSAFEEAFINIKPIDAIVVGMYPNATDQITENAFITSEILKNTNYSKSKACSKNDCYKLW